MIMRGALVIALVLATGCPDNKPPARPYRVETKPGQKVEAKPDAKPRHSSHPHAHGDHPHKRDEHHHHPHPHPHLDGDDGHHHPH